MPPPKYEYSFLYLYCTVQFSVRQHFYIVYSFFSLAICPTSCYSDIKPRIQFLQQSKDQAVFSVIHTIRIHAGHGIYQIELLAGRKPVSQELLKRSLCRRGERLPGELSVSSVKEGISAMKKAKKRKRSSAARAANGAAHMNQEGIAYQNKDITSKLLAENFKGKTFRVYGLDIPEVKAVLPTNIPSVRANELRLDNLFELADGTIALVDYESDYKKEDKVKYLNYLTGIADRYHRERKTCPMLRMIVIYTGDIERRQVSDEYDIGAVRMTLEPAFLSELDSGGIFRHLKEKVERNEPLNDEELMEFIILPLSYRKREEKEEKIRESISLAAQIQDRNQQIFALVGILTFTDKLIDMETANKTRRMIEMTKIGWIIEQEKQEAIAKLEEEKQQALVKAEEEKRQALVKAEEEKQQALVKAEEEKHQAPAKAEAEKRQAAKESVIKMIRKNYSTEEIAFIVSSFSQDDIEAVRREIGEVE